MRAQFRQQTVALLQKALIYKENIMVTSDAIVMYIGFTAGKFLL
jgi:hypothetical protein